MNKNHYIFPLGVFVVSTMCAQSTLNASGGGRTVDGVVHEYSIGEMTLVNTRTSGSLVVTEGVLQPASVVTSTDDSQLSSQPVLNVFPNPTMDVVNIDIEGGFSGPLSYTVTDLAGKVVQQKELLDAAISIDFTQLEKGQYALQLQYQKDGATIHKTYNIQKIR